MGKRLVWVPSGSRLVTLGAPVGHDDVESGGTAFDDSTIIDHILQSKIEQRWKKIE
jgi:hypothetical protein